jgi:broad specificity phosphatase PhoE
VPKGLTLLLVRHAETEWNRIGRYQGCIDTSLSSVGQAQALSLAERLSSLRVAAVYTSPLARAAETAEAIGRAHGLSPVPMPGFREVCHGDWEGLTVEEVAARFPDQVEMRRRHPEQVVMTNGESLSDVRGRALSDLARVQSSHQGETVCMVMHDAPLKMLLLHVLGLGPESFWKFRLASTGLSEIEAQEERLLIRSINDVSHLAGGPAVASHRAM